VKRVLVAVLRDLRASWGRALSVALLLGVGVAIYAGLYAAIDSLFATRDHLFAEGRLSDLEAVFTPEDAVNVPDVSGVQGVADVQERLVLPGNMTITDGTRLPTLLYFLDEQWPQRVDRLTVLQGRPLDPAHPDEALIERSLAQFHGYAPGDPIEVRVGNKRYALHVVGVVQSPEYLLASAAGDFVVPAKGTLGVVYVSSRLMEQALGFRLVDSLLVRYAPGADPGRVRSAIEHALVGSVQLDNLTTRERQPAYRFLQLDLDSFGQYVPAILVVFAMVSALATLLTVARLVQSRRREIGTLQALGYSQRQLTGAYLVSFLFIGALGIALGLLGAFPLRDMFLHDYADAIGLPRVDALMPAVRVAGGVAAGLLLTFVATLVPLRQVLRLTPVEALRPRPATSGATRGGRLLRTLVAPLERSLALRYALRNLVRHRVLTATSIACIALSLAVAVSYSLSMTSMDHSVDAFLGGASWDAAVDLTAPLWPEDVERVAAIPGIVRVEPRLEGHVRVRRAGSAHAVDALLTGLDPRHSLWVYPHLAGHPVSQLTGDEVVLETVVARKLGVAVGDTVELEHEQRVVPVQVAGITSGLSGQAAYSPRGVAEKVLDLEQMNTALLVGFASGADRRAVIAALYDDPDVARVTERSMVADAFRSIMAELWGIVYLAAGLAIGVAILFVVTSLTLTVLEREGEMATMEAIGFGRGTLRRILFSEATAQMALAVLAAAPLAWLLAVFLNARMSSIWFETQTWARPTDFVAVLLPALLLAPLGAVPGLRHVLRLDIAETVRQKTAD
jgi:putative ABC transport system permease protein